MSDIARPSLVAGSNPVLAAYTVVLASSRTGLRRHVGLTLRAGGLDVRAQKANAARALGAVARHRPQVCLFDAGLDGNLMSTITTITREYPDTVIGILADAATEQRAARAMRAGADAVIRDRGPGGDLADEVRRLVERVFPAGEVAEAEVVPLSSAAPPPRPGPSAAPSPGPGPSAARSRPAAPLLAAVPDPPPAGPAEQGGAAPGAAAPRAAAPGPPPVVFAPPPPRSGEQLAWRLLYVPRFAGHVVHLWRDHLPLWVAWEAARERMRAER